LAEAFHCISGIAEFTNPEEVREGIDTGIRSRTYPVPRALCP
jgi:hypothetical protein